MAKIRSLKIKIGSYDKDVQTKGKYIDLGVLMQSQDGGMYALLNPHVNLAGIPMDAGKDMVMCSVFTDQPQQGYATGGGMNNPSSVQQNQYNQQQGTPAQHLPNQNQNTAPQNNTTAYQAPQQQVPGTNIPLYVDNQRIPF